MDHKVPIDRILLVKIKIFDYYEKGLLHEIELKDEDALRPVIFMDGDLIDFRTKTVLSHINQDENGYVIPEIYRDTMYIEEVYKCPYIDEDMMDEADNLYEYYLYVKELKAQKKIIDFQKVRIY